jgi:sugar (pentulose or hexulose) kinase
VAVERWQAVGLSAMLPTLVLTDGVGAAATPGGIDAPSSRLHLEPLGPAITWEDGRAEAEGSLARGLLNGIVAESTSAPVGHTIARRLVKIVERLPVSR